MSYRDWLVRRGAAHFAELPPELPTASPRRAELIAAVILEKAAEQLVSDRQQVSHLNLPPPGLAEYLDLLYALHELFPGQSGAQQQWLGRLSAYGYLKHGVVAGQSGAVADASADRRPAESPAERG
jgi:hypothetical protein